MFLGECKTADKFSVANKEGCIETKGNIGTINKFLVWDYPAASSSSSSWRNITNLIGKIVLNGSTLVSVQNSLKKHKIRSNQYYKNVSTELLNSVYTFS